MKETNLMMQTQASGLIAVLLSDLASSTWKERFKDAYEELRTYRADMELSVLETLKAQKESTEAKEVTTMSQDRYLHYSQKADADSYGTLASVNAIDQLMHEARIHKLRVQMTEEFYQAAWKALEHVLNPGDVQNWHNMSPGQRIIFRAFIDSVRKS